MHKSITFMNKHKSFVIFIIFFVLSLLMIIPYWNFPYIVNDLPYHLAPLNEANYFIQKHQWFNIFSSISTKTMGEFGYPENLFYPSFTYYPVLIFRIIHLSAFRTYLLSLIVINFLAFCSMYIVTKKLTNSKKAALFSSIVYGFSQYKLNDMYVFQNVAESIAFILVPICFYGLYQIICFDYKKWWILSIGLSLLILTHVLSVVVLSVFMLLSLGMLFIKKSSWQVKLKRIFWLIVAGIVSLLLSVIFLGPLIQNYLSINGNLLMGKSILFTNAVNINNVIGASVGLIEVVIIIMALVYFKYLLTFYRYILVEIFISILLITNLFPWGLLQSIMYPIQFPVRFLAITNFLVALIGGKCLLILFSRVSYNNKSKYSLFFGGLVILELCIFTAQAEMNRRNLPKISVDEFNLRSSQISYYDYLPKNAEPIINKLDKHSIPLMNKASNIKQSGYSTSYNAIHYKINNGSRIKYINLPNEYYPGFHAYVNNKEVPIKSNKNNAINIPIQKGRNDIDIMYKSTITQIISFWISIISWIILISFISYKKFINFRIKHKKSNK
ncbi:YfhO family protein [Fructilactobacillus fructivorans]|uniref:YfhO family protein n=2 Tax=Fructilactobacillus fructivorans TaxID=1614 RepID=A0AAE6NZH0_9LACO|nr:YfhO family protein [Fructilactobacillus fructivorans]KRK58227.1 hypothetical protein FC73_GL000609 [Fructilactobacillus fructivorans]KRN40896.1 hypothetical protein IV51_GL001124 [Fructilactobacillus fructivorans]KRN42491.1 hypothetical protein IV48_GL000255 [Fructilactobacillus fructivorans]QFX92215.1 YfhO family protein [Fructilactobacillus fructivorans]RDV65264.1 hypothetical protein DXU76_04595 [Fructilactobacillus fructivorans]